MRLRSLPLAGYEEIAEIARRRAAIPTDKELATKWGVSVRRVQQLMQSIRVKLVPVCVVSKVNNDS